MVSANASVLNYIVETGEWSRYLEDDADAKRGFLDGFFDGDGSGLIPCFANIDIELLE